MTEAARQLAEHHRAFAATNGADPEWPTWYAEFLVPRLRGVLGWSLPAAELAQRLQELHGEHERTRSSMPWPEFYASSLLTLRIPGI